MKRLATFLLATCLSLAQSQKAFDVATIKPNTPSGRLGPQIQGERFLYKGGPLLTLVQYAYALEDFQLSGAPPWARQEMFDIQASAGSGTQLTEALAREMLRSLLTERFGLRMHQDSKEMDVLRLVTNGTPKLTATDRKSSGFLIEREGVETKGATMAELVRVVQRFGDRGRPVVDRTGLTESYEFRLNFATTPAAAANVPDVVTALREQLNLRLEAAKERFDVWVIDSAAKPSEN